MRGEVELLELEDARDVSFTWRALSAQFNPPLESTPNKFEELIKKVCLFGLTFAAFDNGQLAGAISFYSNDVVTREAYVTLLAVLPNWRRRGVGSLLLNCAELVSARLGMEWMRLEVRIDNPSAYAFYRRFGYTESGAGAPGFVSMHRSLSTGRDGLE